MAEEVKLPLSLADLDKDETPEEKALADAKIRSDAEAQVKADAETKANEEKARSEKEAKDKENAGKTPAEIEAETKAAKEKEAADQEANKVEDDTFYEAVDKRHGFKDFKVDFGEVDPLSPEGAYMREKALIDKATTDFEVYLKQEDPRGYAYLLHRRSGKPDEDFFNKPSVVLPEYETFKKDVDLQKNLYIKDLKERGLSDDIVTMAVEKVIKDNKLFETADTVYKAKELSEKKLLETLEASGKQKEQQESQAIQGMNSVLDDIITNSKVDNIVIPDAKKGEFSTFVKGNLFFDGENFFIIKGLNKDNAAALIQAEYFGFVKGNLEEVVRRQAQTKNASDMRRRVTKDTKQAKIGDDTNVKTYVPLSDIN